MKLPTRGCLYNTEGHILWAWEHNDPTTEFEALPPVMTDPATGTQASIAQPDHAVMDLEAITEREDVPTLYQDMAAVRVERTTAGSYCFKQVITNSTGASVRIDHPIMQRINARRMLNNQPALPSTPDRII